MAGPTPTWTGGRPEPVTCLSVHELLNRSLFVRPTMSVEQNSIPFGLSSLRLSIPALSMSQLSFLSSVWNVLIGRNTKAPILPSDNLKDPPLCVSLTFWIIKDVKPVGSCAGDV